MSDDEEFTLEMRSGASDVLDVTLDGELDTADADWVEETLAAAAPHHRHVVIHLDKLTFIDSSGLRTLIVLKQRAELLGLDLHYDEPSDAVMLTLRSAGLMDLLEH